MELSVVAINFQRVHLMDIRLRNRTLICLISSAIVMLTVAIVALSAQSVGAEVTAADLSGSSITVDPELEAPQGSELDYTVVISNSGDSFASGITLSNTLPANTSLVGDIIWPSDTGIITNTEVYSNGVILWGGVIGSGKQATLQYTLLISDSVEVSSTITNSAEISFDTITDTITISTTTFVVAEDESAGIFLPIIMREIAAPSVETSEVRKGATDFNWTLSWELESTLDSPQFLIQESQTEDFSTIISERKDSAFSKTFSHPASYDNIYYYRVRLISGSGSPWSEPIKVINAYYDTFDDVDSGWKIVRQDLDDTSNSVVYRPNDSVLLVDTGGRWDYTIASSLRPAVAGDYRLKTSIGFAGPGNLNTYGIIIGADWNGEECPTLPYQNDPGRAVTGLDVNELETNPLLDTIEDSSAERGVAIDNCFNHYYRIVALWNGHPKDMQLQVKKIQYHDDSKNSGRGPEYVDYIPVSVSSGDTNAQNEWTVEVRRSGNFKLYAGSNLVAEWNDTEFVEESYFGFWSSTDEYPGSDPLVDYVSIEPLD